MTTKSVEIIIATDGSIKLSTHGFDGSACRDASHALERALGITQSDLPTSEMFHASQSYQVTTS